MSARVFFLVASLSLTAIFAPPGWAEDVKLPAALVEKLQSPAILEFVETPLTDLVDYCKETHKLVIRIDRTAIRAAGVAKDPEITINVRGVSFRSAMVLMLRQQGLTCVVLPEFLVITTPVGAKKWQGTPLADIACPPDAEKKIKEALKTKTALEFVETPLKDVVDYIKDLHKIEVQLDQRAMASAKIDAYQPITLNVKDVSLDAGLKLMLTELKLTHKIQDEVLLITPAKPGP